MLLPCHLLEREAEEHTLAVAAWPVIQDQGRKRQRNSSSASIQDSLQTVTESETKIPDQNLVNRKEAIHIRLHPNNINTDSGIEIPEAWIPTIRKHNSRPTTKRTCEGTTSNSRNNNEDRNAPIAANHHATNSDT